MRNISTSKKLVDDIKNQHFDEWNTIVGIF